MIRLVFIFAFALFVTLCAMWKVEAGPPVPDVGQLVRPPYVIQYQQESHAVFDYGGLEFLFVVTKMPTPFPQCNAVRTIGDELMVVGGNPFGYVFFTRPFPIAFKTDHNPLWNDLVKKSCLKEGCK
jgi:hypothetical protein